MVNPYTGFSPLFQFLLGMVPDYSTTTAGVTTVVCGQPSGRTVEIAIMRFAFRIVIAGCSNATPSLSGNDPGPDRQTDCCFGQLGLRPLER